MRYRSSVPHSYASHNQYSLSKLICTVCSTYSGSHSRSAFVTDTCTFWTQVFVALKKPHKSIHTCYQGELHRPSTLLLSCPKRKTMQSDSTRYWSHYNNVFQPGIGINSCNKYINIFKKAKKKKSEYPSKYRGNFCLAVGNTGVTDCKPFHR